MQTFKVICVALLCVAVIALPSEEYDCDGNCDGCDGSCGHINPETEEPELEWWENAVFYQIYPRSFKDSNGDGIGDINGVIEQLDYLQDLGIDGAWLSPIFKSPMKDFGYDISDFYNIDPMFGTLKDIENLFEEAAKRDIKIILDFVPNHSSDQNEWFKASSDPDHPEHEKYKGYYIWADGKNGRGDSVNPPNNWVSIFYGPAWTHIEKRGQWYYHNFDKSQPDLNYRNQAVVDQMIDVLNFWLGKGAGGFRVDAINHLFENKDLLDEPKSNLTNDTNSYQYLLHYYTKDLPEVYEMVYKLREVVDKYQEENGGEPRILMTEAYTNHTEYVKYFKSENGTLGSQMPFNFALISDLSRNSSAADFKNIIDDKIASVPEGTRLNWVMGNHDNPRVGSRYGERRIDGLLTLVMTLPGIAVTYNGEEIGMVDNRAISYVDTMDPAACNLNVTGNWMEESRDPERTPLQWNKKKFAGFMPENSTKIPWLPIHPNYREVNVELQEDTSRSTLNFYKQLLRLRKENTFAYGSYESSVLNENVFAYVRALEKSDTYVVLINFGAREERIDISKLTENLPEELELAVSGSDSCYKQSNKVKAKEVILRKYDTIILKGAHSHVHENGSGGSSVIANIALTFGLLSVASIARFVF